MDIKLSVVSIENLEKFDSRLWDLIKFYHLCLFGPEHTKKWANLKVIFVYSAFSFQLIGQRLKKLLIYSISTE